MPIRNVKLSLVLPAVWAVFGILAPPSFAQGQAAADSKPFGWLDFKYLVKFVGSGTYAEIADSTANPGNDVFLLPSATLDGQVRLDINANAGPISFLIKPRQVVDWNTWNEGPRDGDSEESHNSYVNEWQLRLSIRDKAFVSYGRENLQWGPSFLFSPSNPFNQDNGQNNPKRELPGMDFAKVLWIPAREWSVSLIANTGEGRAKVSRNVDEQYDSFVDGVNEQMQRNFDLIDKQYSAGIAQIDQVRDIVGGHHGPLADAINARADQLEAYAKEQRDLAVTEVNRQGGEALRQGKLERDTYSVEFERNYAAKIDFQQMQKYATLIASYKETDEREDIKRTRLGAFGGWTASEAVLLYTEATASLRGDELYPVEDSTSPFGSRLSKTRASEDEFKAVALAGGSYTFIGGQTIVAEYLYNGAGYNGTQADRYYRLRSQAADALDDGGELSTLAYVTLGEAAAPGMRFIRRNYLLLQYQQMQLLPDLGFVLRCTVGLDDGSVQLIPILQYNLGDRWQFFAVCNRNLGPRDTEFTSAVDGTYQLGCEVTF